jgi:carboxylesterase type B
LTSNAAGIRHTFGEKADKVLAQYPWPKDADKYTGAYLAGAVVTDSNHIAGIGGCASLKLTQDFAKYAPVYAYEFGHRAGPGLTREHGVYEWGAGHAAELAYLFPRFNNGEPITPLFNAGERVLAESMKGLPGRIRETGDSRRQDRRDLADLHVAPSERSVLRAFDRDVRPRAQLQILGGERALKRDE